MDEDPERTLVSTSSMPTPVEAGLPRRNGWSCPWHPFMGIAWFFIALFALAYFGFLVFYVPGLYIIIATVIPGLLLITHVIANVVTTSIDPGEREVRQKRSHPNQFDRTAHEHVIENNYCHICQVNVSHNAKHCRICNKCVVDFDHHCLWLNSCIGSRNYRWFLATIVSALLSAILLFLYCLVFFVLYFADRDSVRFNCPTPSNLTSCDSTLRVLGAPIPDVLFPILLAVLGVLALVAVGLVGHLTGFHIYLLIKGLSTYDHILQLREAEQRASVSRPPRQRRSFHDIICLKIGRKPSRVSPTSDGDTSSSSVHSISPQPNGPLNGSGSRESLSNFGRTPPPPLSDNCSTGSGNCDNFTDQQHLIVENSSNVSTSRKTDTVIEVELTALDVSPAISTTPQNGCSESNVDDEEMKRDESNPGSQEPLIHHGPALSPRPLSPVEKKSKESHIVVELDQMDSATQVTMAGMNSIIEREESIKKITVDQGTSPIRFPDLMPDASNVNTNANNNIIESVKGKEFVGEEEVKEVKAAPEKAFTDEEEAKKVIEEHQKVVVDEKETKKVNEEPEKAFTDKEEAKTSTEQHCAELLGQYRQVILEKKLKRTSSVGSMTSRRSLPSSHSEDFVRVIHTSRSVTDKINCDHLPLLSANHCVGASPKTATISVLSSADLIPEGLVKRVSFQDILSSPPNSSPATNSATVPMPIEESLDSVGRPLPVLPPIRAAEVSNWTVSNRTSSSALSPRTGNNRPLPPLTGMGNGNLNSVAYDTVSLQSVGSSSTNILYSTGSVNSLPGPDPRYVRGHAPKQTRRAKRKTPPPSATSEYRPNPITTSLGVSNVGGGRLSPRSPR